MPDLTQIKKEIINAGKYFDKKAWLPATSGNLSMRANNNTAALTVSGKAKGSLEVEDIILVDMNGQPLDPGKKPSAETLLHTQLYQWNSEIQAVFHVHSINSVVISKLHAHKKEITLKNYELLKALNGVTTHLHSETVPIFENTQDIAILAKQVEEYLHSKPNIHGYLIEGHGIYSWGASAEEALRHIECFETLFEIEWKLH